MLIVHYWYFDRLNQHKAEEYTADIKSLCDASCKKFNLPNLDEPCILEGTITNERLEMAGNETNVSDADLHKRK